jgi:LysR family transcriptional regulator, glycine cleavage system transcriptional activator
VVALGSPLDLESLRCFVAAVEQQSFRAAAKACALSPAAFGDRIRRLEEELGSALFTRTTRKLSLTPQAERLLPQARRALEEAERCRNVVHDQAKAPFELKIGTRFELGLSFMVPALKRLEHTRPERRLHLYFGDTPDLLPRVLRGELSCMITSARLVSPGLSFARLHEEHYVLVGKTSLVKRRKLTEPADAQHHALLDLHEDLPLFRYFLDARSAKEVWQFRELSYLGAIAAVRARALEGAGVGVLPHYFVKEDLAAGRLVRLMPKTKLPSDWFRLVWRTGHQREPELQQLAGELSELPLR